jgi:hypothetical protein
VIQSSLFVGHITRAQNQCLAVELVDEHDKQVSSCGGLSISHIKVLASAFTLVASSEMRTEFKKFLNLLDCDPMLDF